MITANMIIDAQDTIRKNWEKDGNRVIEAAAKVVPFNGSFSDFLSHCFAKGGDWGAMLLTGINNLWPEVWDAIPDNMGPYAFIVICNTLILCGVDTSE